MKQIFMILALLGSFTFAQAEETIGEKTEAKVNDAKREIKKSYHRGKEKFCAKGDVACLKERAAHRADEGSDYIRDKSKQLKDKVDNNSTVQ